MPHVCAQLSPVSCSITIGKLNQVKCILNIWIELIERHKLSRIKLASHSTTQNGKWRRTNIFSELEVFKKSQTKRLKIIRCRAMLKFCVPSVDHRLAQINIADSLLPLIAFR